jgi:hypothetical protein
MRMQRSHLVVLTVAVALLLASGGLWAYTVDQSPSHVFADMLRSNLSTTGVTRILQQQGSGLDVSQYTQLTLGSQPTAHALTFFNQNGGSIVTEEVSNRANDYVRYKKIVATSKSRSGKVIDTSGLVGKWAKLGADGSLGSSVTAGLFDQALLGVLPIGNLSTAGRQQLLTYINGNSIFSFDTSKVKKLILNGRPIYQYDVSVKPAVYVALMQQFGKMVGATEYANLNPSDYSGASILHITISVDRSSHTLAQVYQSATRHTETYTGFGISAPVAMPTATLTTKQLEDRITSLQP